MFDEATSALDNKTEMDLINSINKLSEECTIISIAHRQSTIANCNKLIKLENGKITFIGKPNEID